MNTIKELYILIVRHPHKESVNLEQPSKTLERLNAAIGTLLNWSTYLEQTHLNFS
jgi:hypothetical protein